MKSTTLSILLGLSLTLGGTITSRAEGQNTIRIPNGRGQYAEVQTVKLTTIALFVRNESRSAKVTNSASELRPATVANARGASVTLFERAK